MRNIETFAVIGGDLRSAYLAGLLAADGYKVITSGFDSTDLPPCVTGCTNPAQATTLADCVILPLPVTTDGSNINAPFSRMRITLDQVLNALAPHQSLVGGAVSDIVRREVESRGMAIHDYLQREELAIANSVPTAEGAIQLAMEELPITLHGSKALVVGYGRLGHVLARQLRGLGAAVSVAARNYTDLAWAQVWSYGVERSDQLSGWLCGYDLVINTVPAPVLGRAELADLKPGCLVIDLASKPGGVDFTAAAELGVKVIWALSLPGKTAPVTAGLAIKNTICNILTELGV